MWAVGCILGEMLGEKRPLFPGLTDLSQLRLIFEILGTPSAETQQFLSTLPYYCDFEPTEPVDFTVCDSSVPLSSSHITLSLLLSLLLFVETFPHSYPSRIGSL